MEYVQSSHDRSSICWQSHPCRTHVVSLITGAYLWPLQMMCSSPVDKRRVDMSTTTTTALDCTAQLLTCSGLALHLLCIALNCTKLQCLHLSALHCNSLHFTALHCTADEGEVCVHYSSRGHCTVKW